MMANVEEDRNCVPESSSQTQLPCRFYSQGKPCRFGKKCRFLHVGPRLQEVRPSQLEDNESIASRTQITSRTRAAPTPRPCRYFLSGFCSMEDRCRFLHPAHMPPLEDIPSHDPQPCNLQPRNPQPRNPQPRNPQPRNPQPCNPQPCNPQPCNPQPRNLQSRDPQPRPQPRGPDLTRDLKLRRRKEMVQQLRLTEIQQLKKRFPKDLLIIQEQQDMAYYRATVEATDPDWPFDLKEIDIMVSFPDNYPEEIFTLEIPLDQLLPQVMASHVQEASVQWLQAKHATNQLLGKVELLFRPFLRWLDRSLERLFIEGAKQLKKDIDLEKAGLQFISYQELQAAVSEKQTRDEESEQPKEAASERTEDSGSMWPEEAEPEKTEEAGSEQTEDDGVHLVENIRLQERPKGTEIQLLGLSLGHNTATVMTQKITVCLRCNRCKMSAELSLSGGALCVAQCEKCSSDIRAGFTPSILHQYSTVLGHLQLHNTTALDLLVNRCLFTVGCLSCSQDSAVENLSYGQTKEFNCEHCHEKLSIAVESARFLFIQPRSCKTGPNTNTGHFKNIRDPAVQKGKPLPDKGTCKHYRQSHRWLRFPCCGRVYPCDVCHDEDQDHPMELATRMICGFCAKEQSYGNGKPCVTCGSLMTKGTRSTHWEGGQGCRNKVKMCRNDRQKYANSNKTISRKAASEKN
ncbi:uncharacterized protein [Eucyclogobius newberryi]|uniref:uncharacterized protein n=1 Tax=Eucyclogobius newberryi TaxID=166745 RepID=UPI003B5917C5